MALAGEHPVAQAVKSHKNEIVEVVVGMLIHRRQFNKSVGPERREQAGKYLAQKTRLDRIVERIDLVSKRIEWKTDAPELCQQIYNKLVAHHDGDSDKVHGSMNRVGLKRPITAAKCRRILACMEKPDKCWCGDGRCPHCSVNPF